MRAMRIHQTGGADAITEDRVDRPSPGAGDALVRVEYAGVNFIDVYKRTGLYKVPLPATLGEEGAGVVESVGDGVREVKAGDRVAWAGAMGAYAEYAAVKASRLVPVPRSRRPWIRARMTRVSLITSTSDGFRNSGRSRKWESVHRPALRSS